jgi:hypothetical protein
MGYRKIRTLNPQRILFLFFYQFVFFGFLEQHLRGIRFQFLHEIFSVRLDGKSA